jgi:hypothetical protein
MREFPRKPTIQNLNFWFSCGGIPIPHRPKIEKIQQSHQINEKYHANWERPAAADSRSGSENEMGVQ